jgi:hydroxymethylbilane synthase
VPIRTSGDVVAEVPLSQVAGRAFFTKEIEEALLAGEIDLAVHSLKDLATDLPAGLALGAILERADPRDALIARRGGGYEALPPGARVGTSSLRRRALLRRWRSDVEVVDMRGNVPTRVARLEAGDLDAIVLAAAGLERLGLGHRVTEVLPTARVLPAAGQGAIAIEIRADDDGTRRAVARLDHDHTRAATVAERALLGRLEGGCQVPVGALAEVRRDRLHLAAAVCSLDGRQIAEAEEEGDLASPVGLAEAVADALLRAGAGAILASVREVSGAPR